MKKDELKPIDVSKYEVTATGQVLKMSEVKLFDKPKVKPIPLWKWILLYFCREHITFDTEGDIAMVCWAKILFNHIYIVREDYYCKTTGNLLRTGKLTRKGLNKYDC